MELLRIDPGIPLVWRSPHEVQLGVDPVLVRWTLPPRLDRVLAALRAGAPRAAIDVIGDAAGCTSAEVAEALERLAPVLLGRAPVAAAAAAPTGLDASAALPRVAVCSAPGRADQLLELLRGAGIDPIAVHDLGGIDAAIADGAALAVLVGEHVLPPALAAAWLRRDVPHLPLVHGERAVRVGPLVRPGRTACLHCVERHRAEADPAWPVVASQLLGLDAQTTGSALGRTAALEAVRLVRSALEGGAADAVLRFDPDGCVSAPAPAPHPECLCSAEALRGIGSAAWRRVRAVPARSTTAPASAALA